MPEASEILVLGAGELGMAVLRGLVARGATPSVLLRPSTIDSRDPAKARDVEALRSLGVSPLPGDLAEASETELADVFREFDTVIGCTGFSAGRGVQIKLARAALIAEVGRYVPWQFGVDYDAIGRGGAQDLFDEQLDVRDLLRAQSRVEWIIISTGMFTSFLFDPSFGVVDLENNTVRALGSWDNAVTVTTPEDIGTLTAEILFAKPRIANQVVFTAGDTISYGRLADVVDSTLGRKVSRVVWSLPELREELARDPDNSLKKYRVVFAEGRGVSWGKDRAFNAKRGIDVMDVEQWLRASLSRPSEPAPPLPGAG